MIKVQVLEEYRGNPDNAEIDSRMFTELIRCSELTTLSYGNKIG